MDRDDAAQGLSGLAANTERVTNGRLPHHDEARLPEKQEDLYVEVEWLRLEVERLRDQQQALQRTPQSNDTQVDDDSEHEESDDSHAKRPAGRGRVLHRRPVSLIAALVVAALLCAGGRRLWNSLQSFEWTDDAEIDGHLDPLSSRIDGTVGHVYVDNTYHVRKGQPLVDPDPPH